MQELRPIFRHWRIPTANDSMAQHSKGRPPQASMYRYSRGTGFVTVSSRNPHRLVLHVGVVPRARGGMTQCLFINNAGTVIAAGRAMCSMSDNFNYRVGRDIALERATHNLRNLTKRRELEEEVQVHGHC